MSFMSKAEFVVAFKGPGVSDGTIDVRDLAPALLSLGQAIDAANRAVNGDQVPAKVQAKAVAEGSFEVSLQVVVSGWEAVKGLLLSDDAQAAKTLLEWIGIVVGGGGGTLFALYRFLHGRAPERLLREGSSITIVIGDERLTVPIEVLRMYQDLAVNQAIAKLLKSLEGDRVDTIEFLPAHDAEPAAILTRPDVDAFSVPKTEDQVVLDDTRIMALSIRSLAFQEGNKWRLFDGQNVITATIQDEDFLGKVDRNEIRFAKSDILMCEVRTVQKETAEGLKTEHEIIRVSEHRPAPRQISLFE